MSECLMTEDETVSALLAFVYSGAIGSTKTKYVYSSLIKTTSTTTSWSVALESLNESDMPVDPY